MASPASVHPFLTPDRASDVWQLRQAVEHALAGRVSTGFAHYPTAEFERVSTGIAALDELTGGLPRGALSEICGPASSGRTTAMIAALAHATSQGEACCLVDVTDAFNPRSAAAAGVDLNRVLWVRCNSVRNCGTAEVRNCFSPQSHRDTGGIQNSKFKIENCSADDRRPTTHDRRPSSNGFAAVEQALKATDLILQGGGFGFVAIDMGDVPSRIARRVPLTSWFRFRRAVEKTRTVLLVVEQEAHASSCAALVVNLTRDRAPRDEETITHAQLLHGIDICAEVTRTPGKKQPQRAQTRFCAESEWAIG